MAFGVVGLVSVLRLVLHGWAAARYSEPALRFTYLGFDWVPRPGPAALMTLLAVVGAAALLVAIGLWYRAAIAVFFVGFTWIELIDVTTYLNHYWFVTLVAFLLCFVPADACWSVRSWRHGERAVPLGAVHLLRAQVGIVYAFAAVAKLHADWLWHGLPLRLWLPARDGLGPLDALLDQAWLAHALSVAGAAFDLTVVPLLLWRRTRPFAFAAVVVFHVLTWRLFAIGVFPWLMIAGASLFFDPGWPRRVLPWARAASPATGSPPPATARRRLAMAAALLWLAVQVALPLRHHLYPGDARWTSEGYRFSWNVLAVERSGVVEFRLTDPATGRTWIDDARSLYTEEQWQLMATEPDLIHQAALELARRARAAGHAAVEVRADAFVSLNARPAARLVDPTVDLAAQPHDLWHGLGHEPWVLPAPTSPPP